MLCVFCQRKDLIKLTEHNRARHIKACKLKYGSENTEKVEKSLMPNAKGSSSNKKMEQIGNIEDYLLTKMHQNKLKHAQGLFQLCDKFDKNDESEEISMSLSSNEASDQENDELVAADKHGDTHDQDFDNADDLIIRHIKNLKENLTSTPRLEPFKVNIVVESKLSDNNNNTIQETSGVKNKNLFNSDLSPLVFQRRKVAFEQNRNQLSQFVLRKNFELSNMKNQENLPLQSARSNDNPSCLKTKTKNILKDLCLNYQERIENENDDSVQEVAPINENAEQNEVIELTANDSRLHLLENVLKKNTTILIDSSTAHDSPSKSHTNKDKSRIVISSNRCNALKENDHIFASTPASVSRLNILNVDQSLIAKKAADNGITNINDNYLNHASFVDYEYSLIVPDTQVQVQQIIPDTQVQAQQIIPDTQTQGMEEEDQTLNQSKNGEDNIQKTENNATKSVEERHLLKVPNSKQNNVNEKESNDENLKCQYISYRPELILDNKCSTPNNLKSMLNVNEKINKQNDVLLDESQIVINSLKSSIPSQKTQTNESELNKKNLPTTNERKTKRNENVNDSIIVPPKKSCLDTFAEPIPPPQIKPKKQIVMIINGSNSSNKSTSSNKFTPKIDLRSFARDEYNKSQALEKSSNSTSGQCSTINSNQSSNESDIRPRKNLVMTVSKYKADPKKDALRKLMLKHASMADD